jgi:hypothetical protein
MRCMKTQLSATKIFAVLIFFASISIAEPPIPKLLADKVVSTDAFSRPVANGDGLNGISFQQDAIRTYLGWQYAAFYNTARHVCVSRRKLPDGAWQFLELTDYTQRENDSHNVITFGICPKDGTMHLAFDHHVSTLHYRKSVAGLVNNPETATWNASQFGTVQNQLNGTVLTITYPMFITTPGGDLLLSYRIGAASDGDNYIHTYNGSTGKWINFGSDSRYIDGVSNYGYINGLDYDSKGHLHVTWCWRESGNDNSNHNLMYAYSEDNAASWKTNSGADAGKTGSKPIVPTTTGITVWNIPENTRLLNSEAQAIDPKDRVHAFMRQDSTFPDGTTKTVQIHFWRDETGKWTRINTHILAGVYGSSRCKIAFDADANAYAMLPGFRIASASAAAKWQDWKITYTGNGGKATSEPLYDRARLAQEGILSVFWQEVSTTGTATLRIHDYQLAATPTSTSITKHSAAGKTTGSESVLSGPLFWRAHAKAFSADGRLRKHAHVQAW